jgi:hypothetical protein
MLSFLVGKELVQVCFEQFDLPFHFHPETNLTVFHKLQLTGSCGQIWEHGQILEHRLDEMGWADGCDGYHRTCRRPAHSILVRGYNRDLHGIEL